MKYYYGNSVKEALANSAVEIKTTKQLQQYEENYSVVIPAEDVDDLPAQVDIEINSCLADAIENKDYVEEYINNYLSDSYGYCNSGYNYNIDGDCIHVTNIEWDVSGE